MKLLLIDDDPESVREVKGLLRGWGYEVLIAESAPKALERLSGDEDIDLVLTDWSMPNMSGLEVCRRARELKRSRFLPIMMLSEHEENHDPVDALNAGADAFVTKPIHPRELRAELRVLERVLDLERRLAGKIEELEAAQEKIQALAETDDLTGLPNRRRLVQRLDEEIMRAERYNMPFAVLLADIDHFKKVNDTHGHPAGDEVLKQLASILQRGLRQTDVFGRYGGEEFMGILSQTDEAGTRLVGERLRKAVEEERFQLPNGTSLQITISLGGALWRRGNDSGPSIIERADAALYRAKEQGRNRLEVKST